MTLREFLDINYQNLLKGYGYEEVKVYDRNWSLIALWFNGDDPHSHCQSKILRIQPVNDDSGINRVRVVIDFKKGD